MSTPVASHEVTARVVWGLVRMLENVGRSAAPLFEGLPWDLEALEARRSVSWDDYVAICENVLKTLGGWDELERLIEHEHHRAYPELRAAARALLDVKRAARLTFELLVPLAFPPLHTHWEDLGEDELRLTVRVRPGARPNPILLRASAAAIRGFPKYLDLPPARVEAQVEPDFAVYDISLPRSRRRVGHASKALLQRIFSSVSLGQEVRSENPLDERLPHVAAVWGLTPRQSEVLRLVAQGQANKDIARAHDCAENTVELHLTQLLKKAQVTSRAQLIAQFWQQ